MSTTGKILDALKREGHKATFFVIGKKAEKHPEIVKRIVAEGHALGSHSYSHPRLFSLLSLAAVVVAPRHWRNGIVAIPSLGF